MAISKEVVLQLLGHKEGVVSYVFISEDDQREFCEMYKCAAYLCLKCLQERKNIREKIFHDPDLVKCYNKCPICYLKLEKPHDIANSHAEFIRSV